MKEKASGKIIGIDLGTTNSVVSVVEMGTPNVIINEQGARTTPSVVAFTDKGERLVGQPAKHQQVTNPENTVFSVKRFMGRRHNEVTEEEKIVPYKVTGDSSEIVKIKVKDKSLTPQEISSYILSKLKKVAEDYLGEKVDKAVITVPAYFNDEQRKATKEAGEIAGLNVERIINEPTAAALAYGMDGKKEGNILAFDFGGGTFDVSCLSIGEGVFEVLATNGDTHLGGDDIDEILINHIADDFKSKEGIDIRKDPMALQRLKEAAEKAKCELSSSMETNINLPFITADSNGPKHLNMNITRSCFESMIESVIERLKKPCEAVMRDANLSSSDIENVILVGGSTRIPKIREMVKEFFGKEPDVSVNPDEVVAMGAAVQGGILSGDVEDEMVLLDVTPLSLGVETLGGVMTKLIEKNTTIPHEKKEIFSTASDNQTEVTIHVLQGEREFAKDNRTLGQFNLSNIPMAPRGIPQIEVSFSIDTNGILDVSAKDTATNNEQSITINGTTGLNDDEIEKMKKDAEKYAEEDKAKRELIELKNKAESLVYSAEKSVSENEMSDELKSSINDSISLLKDKLENDDKDGINKAMSNLEQEMHKYAQEVYATSQQETTDSSTGSNNQYSADEADDIIDAEYEESTDN